MINTSRWKGCVPGSQTSSTKMEHFYQNIGEDWFTYPDFYRKAVRYFDEGHFVEVGSWKGRSACFLAVEIANNNKQIKLTCVDTWGGSPEHEGHAEYGVDKLYETFLKNIEPVKDIIIPFQSKSLDAVKSFEDGVLDFVFIDAAHDYENVTNDLNAWYPKVRNGGLFAGHDYCGGWPEVVRAVDDWARLNDLEVEILGPQQVWYLMKKI